MSPKQNLGILGQKAPLWNVHNWFNLSQGQTKLELTDLQDKVIYLYNFQSWCPGCHSHGFPTLLEVKKYFDASEDVAFVAVQTVFEGFDSNTFESAKSTAEKFGLDIPFGHDPGESNHGSNIMRAYRAGGTPWITIIGKDQLVKYNDFHGDTKRLTELLSELQA